MQKELKSFIDNDNTKYIVEESFNHVYTNELMYRIKRIYPSGGLDFVVWTDEFLKKFESVGYDWSKMQ